MDAHALHSIRSLIFFAFAIPLCISDYKTLTVPRGFAAFLSILLVALSPSPFISHSLVGLLSGYASGLLTRKCTDKLGRGDPAVLGATGALGGSTFLLLSLSVALLPILFSRKKSPLPFFPYITAGAALSLAISHLTNFF